MNYHITLTPQGRDALEQVILWLEGKRTIPKQEGRCGFHMSYGVEEVENLDDLDLAEHGLADCGTVCCIGGAIALLEDSYSFNWGWGALEHHGAEVLSSSPKTEMRAIRSLFMSGNSRWVDYADYAKPHHAVKVIRHLLDTGEVDWDVAGIRVPEGEDISLPTAR